MLKQAALLVVLSSCWRGSPEATSTPEPTAVSVKGSVVPSVRLMTQAEEDIEGSGGQTFEGFAPLAYENFPAVSADGSAIAVVEERDGWGHVKRFGIRVLDREGRTITFLDLKGDRAEAEALVKKANTTLATRTWLPLETPRRDERELSQTEAETILFVGDYVITYKQRRDEAEDFYLPPSVITVRSRDKSLFFERMDTERAWASRPACNLPAFEAVAANERARVVLFTTGLGMGGHNCDGVEQPPAWHVLAF